MTSREERCAEHAVYMAIDAAFRAGDLDALLRAVGDPAVVPNGTMPVDFGNCLEYAIYHSPLAFVRTLLEMGADAVPADHAGFPPLIAALVCARPAPGASVRTDVHELLELLLEFGADPQQRGLNDYTALHFAAEDGNLDAVKLLLEHGADPGLRTRIDGLETPREIAVNAGHESVAAALAIAESTPRRSA